MNGLFGNFELIAPRLGMSVTHSLWQGAAIAIVLAVVLRLTRRSSAAVRYAAGCGAMVLFVVAVVVTFVELAPAVLPPAPVIEVSLPPTAPMPRRISLPVKAAAPPEIAPAQTIDPMRWTGFAWLLGASAVALWHLAGWMWIRRFVPGNDGCELHALPMLARLARNLGVRQTFRLIETARLHVPAVIGVLRPVILIPLGFLNDLPADQVEAILIHELAHIRRHDYLVNLLQVVIESLLFYHPATWWISSQIRRERENCCDDIAASNFAPATYVSALLALEQRRWPLAGAMVAANGGTLLERVHRLLGAGPRIRRRPVRSALAAIMVLACVGLPIAMQGCDKSKPSGGSPAAPAGGGGGSTGAVVKSDGITDDDVKPDLSVGRIGPGDLVSVTIQDLVATGVETAKQSRVADPDGTITMPLVKAVKISGMTESEAQAAIGKVYSAAAILSNPQVSVVLIEQRSATYTVLGGGVEAPGEFPISSPENRLTTALVCGKVRLNGQKEILVRRRAPNATTRTLTISVAQLMSGDSKVDVFLRPGDVIILPRLTEPPPAAPTPTSAPIAASDPGQYYIGGSQISRGGVYAIPPGNITLKQAIIAASGTEGYISVVRREGANESRVWFDNGTVGQLNSGGLPDLIVHAGDTITVTSVPEKWWGKSTTQEVRP